MRDVDPELFDRVLQLLASDALLDDDSDEVGFLVLAVLRGPVALHGVDEGFFLYVGGVH